jgi:hypothetical protein
MMIVPTERRRAINTFLFDYLSGVKGADARCSISKGAKCSSLALAKKRGQRPKLCWYSDCWQSQSRL